MRMNPRTFVKDAASRGVSNLRDLIAQMCRHPGLRNRDPRQLAERWACRLGLLRRWRRKERAEAARLRVETLMAASRTMTSAIQRAAAPIQAVAPSLRVSAMIDIGMSCLVNPEPPKPVLTRKQRRDLQFGRSSAESASHAR